MLNSEIHLCDLYHRWNGNFNILTHAIRNSTNKNINLQGTANFIKTLKLLALGCFCRPGRYCFSLDGMVFEMQISCFAKEEHLIDDYNEFCKKTLSNIKNWRKVRLTNPRDRKTCNNAYACLARQTKNQEQRCFKKKNM